MPLKVHRLQPGTILVNENIPGELLIIVRVEFDKSGKRPTYWLDYLTLDSYRNLRINGKDNLIGNYSSSKILHHKYRQITLKTFNKLGWDLAPKAAQTLYGKPNFDWTKEYKKV